MTELAPLRQYDLATVRRAFDASDPHGEAALNALLYASAALLMSAVLLVITTPIALAIPLAVIPWAVLALFGWWWIAPALRDEVLIERTRSARVKSAHAVAADVLLDDGASTEDRRAAAAFILETIDPAERDREAQRLLESGETEPT